MQTGRILRLFIISQRNIIRKKYSAGNAFKIEIDFNGLFYKSPLTQETTVRRTSIFSKPLFSDKYTDQEKPKYLKLNSRNNNFSILKARQLGSM